MLGEPNVNRLSVQDRVQILNCLSEGMGVNATARLTGTSKNTVLKLLGDVGEACALYQDRVMRHLRCKRLRVDEIWSCVGARHENVRPENRGSQGDVYTYTAIDLDTKLMPCWFVGQRINQHAEAFVNDLAPRFAGRVQLTVDIAFDGNVDYGALNKSYADGGSVVEAKRRYSPADFVSAENQIVFGDPDEDHISTSHAERANLSMRMGMRRFTRLTNAFSKKLQNHMQAISFYFMVYNFVKIHKSMKTTPAMEAGVTDFLWSMEDIVMMADTNA